MLILKKDTTSSKTFSSWIGPGEIIEVKSPSSYLVEVGGARKVYHVNDLRKCHIRIDYALCDSMCTRMPQNYSCTNTGTVNTCAVVYEKDADFGRIDVIEPTQSESEVVGNSEGPSGGSRAAAAVADGCREVVVVLSSPEPGGDWSRSACTSATTIPVAELVDTWPPISSGSV